MDDTNDLDRSQGKLPLPPFLGRTYQKHPPNGLWLYVGPHAWRRAKATMDCAQWRCIAILPKSNPYPYDYHWPIDGMDVLVLTGAKASTKTQWLSILSQHLLEQGANAVRIIHPDYSMSVYTNKEESS